MKKHERRMIEIRADVPGDGERPRIRGYAATFDQPYDLGLFIESIAQGAFDESLDRGDDVRALINHDPNLVLGRTASGTLKLEVDEHGLRMDIDPPETQAARDLLVSMNRGDVSQASFGFFVDDETEEETEDGAPLRVIRKASLFDVSVVTFPANPATEAEARSVEDVYRERFEKRDGHEPDAGEAEADGHEPDDLLPDLDAETEII